MVIWVGCLPLDRAAGKEGKTMAEVLVIVVLVILFTPIFKDQKYKEMERQKDMRRAMMKLQDKYRHNSL
jgi:uncharacterized membrane protein